MSKTAVVLLPLLAAAAFGLTLAASQSQSTSPSSRPRGSQTKSSKWDKDVLATVNREPIREADVRIALRSGAEDQELTAAQRKNLLEVIIRRELISQRAVELGLDANPRYQDQVRRMEAQLRAFKRKQLSELFFRREIVEKAAVSEAEAQAYFDADPARIRTELHVHQILRRDEGSIDRVRETLEQGTSFEEVVRRQFPKVPDTGRAPWDLGYLRWKQVPESWRNVIYDLKQGEVSGVIRGPNSRFWIIKLIDKRENANLTFQYVKPTIVEILKSAKTKTLRGKTDRDLRAKADIVYLKGPPGGSE